MNILAMRLLYVQGAFNEERHLVEVEHLPNYMLRPYLCYIAISTRSPQTCYVIKGPMCSDEDAKHAKVSAALLFSNKLVLFSALTEVVLYRICTMCLMCCDTNSLSFEKKMC